MAVYTADLVTSEQRLDAKIWPRHTWPVRHSNPQSHFVLPILLTCTNWLHSACACKWLSGPLCQVWCRVSCSRVVVHPRTDCSGQAADLRSRDTCYGQILGFRVKTGLRSESGRSPAGKRRCRRRLQNPGRHVASRRELRPPTPRCRPRRRSPGSSLQQLISTRLYNSRDCRTRNCPRYRKI